MKRYPSLLAAVLLLAALLPSRTQAQPISLPSTWGQYDLQEQIGYSAGLLTLAGQSSSGFSATVSSNGISPGAGGAPTFPSKSQYLPRVYTLFAGQPITNNGQRVTFSFDVKFNTVADPSNVGSFRISMGDTNCNNAWGAFMGMGTTSGSTLRYDSTITQDTNWFNPINGYYLFMPPDLANPMNPTNYSFGSFCDLSGSSVGTTSGSTFRYDATITQDTNWFNPINGYYLFMPPDLANPMNPTNYSFGSFCDLSGSSVGGASAPNGVGMGVDTTTVHHFRFSVE